MFLSLLSEGGGFDPLDPHSALATAIWTWIIFLAALTPVWKVVMGPITRALTQRDAVAAEAVHSAERASEEAERARAEVEVRLGEARTEAARLLEDARARGEVREREIVENAKQEAVAMVEKARVEIRAEKDKAMTAIRNEVVELSLAAAGQILHRRVDSEDDRRLAAELVSSTKRGRA
jgi:F-type H+-transporting ATPase subunit b